jgi:signal transduction histidine kinase
MAKGIREEVIRQARSKLGDGIAGRVAKEMKPILIEDFNRYPHLRTRNGRKYKTDSCMSVPLIVDGKALGVVNVTDKTSGASFTGEDLETLTSIANQVAGTIRNSRIYEELKRLDRIKSDFLAILSHELKSPLTNILTSLDTFLEEVGVDLKTEHKRFLELAKNNIKRLTRLVNDLLDISKFDAGKVELSRNKIDIVKIVKRTGESLKSSFDRKGINFSLELPEREIIMWGDEDRIVQVLTNLLNNALKFTPQGGKVSAKLEDRPGEIMLSVADTGVGIAKGDIEKVFDKFSSLTLGKDGLEHGAGLGLSISKDIVALHKGNIWAESEEGKGSRFFVELPKDLRRKEAPPRR